MLRAISTVCTGLGVTLASTFAASLGLSVHQERIGFAVGIALILVGCILFVRSWKTSAPLSATTEQHRRQAFIEDLARIDSEKRASDEWDQRWARAAENARRGMEKRSNATQKLVSRDVEPASNLDDGRDS